MQRKKQNKQEISLINQEENIMKKLLAVKEFNAIKNALKETKRGDLVKTVNARDVHEWLGVKTPFHKWIKRRVDSLMLIENIDYVVVGENTREASAGGLLKNGQRVICLMLGATISAMLGLAS